MLAITSHAASAESQRQGRFHRQTIRTPASDVPTHRRFALTTQPTAWRKEENYDINRTFNIENEINNFRNQLKTQNINDVNNHLYTYAIGTTYMDIISECEKLGDYVVNVVEARMGIRQRD